jgi:hypothetical protein
MQSSGVGSVVVGCLALVVGAVVALIVAGPLIGLVEELSGGEADWVGFLLLVLVPFAALVLALRWMGRNGRNATADGTFALARQLTAGVSTVWTAIVVVAGIIILLIPIGPWTVIIGSILAIIIGAYVVWRFARQSDG